MRAPVEVVVLGAGSRAFYAYGPYALAHPDELRVVAVAEPDDAKRARFAAAHAIPAERTFRSWTDLLARPALAPAVLNCTSDGEHLASTLAAIGAGHDVLLEKPMAPRAEDCVRIVRAAEDAGRLLQVCHVLRYAPFFTTVHEIVRSGRLGEIVSVGWNENLSYAHMAHSFVRGNWARSDRTAPMILTKCCHDLDLLVWLMDGAPVSLSSVGTTQVFRGGHPPAPHARVAPPERCTDGCSIEDECPYYAPRIYLGDDVDSFMVRALSVDLSAGSRRRALETGPYGRCVYRSDNDVVDHQVVAMSFDGGATATLTMQGFSHLEGRTLRIDGTRATLLADQRRREIVVHDHDWLPGRDPSVEAFEVPPAVSGHGGGDFGLIAAFVRTVRDREAPLTSARASLDSHLMAFAAEEARVTNTVVQFPEYRARVERAAAAPPLTPVG